MNRKGTEKPIEIFVALFIILAVALVMLKLFQSQIADKTKELSDVQQAQKSKELRSNVDQSCKDKCVDASNNGCSIATLAALCTHGSHNVLGADQFIDLNNNKALDYDKTLLTGIGICEDRIYCFHLLESCCAQPITPTSCRDILQRYWSSKGFSAADQTGLLNSLVPLTKSAACTPDDDSWRKRSWGST